MLNHREKAETAQVRDAQSDAGMSEPVYRNAEDLTGVSMAEVPTLRSSDTWLP